MDLDAIPVGLVIALGGGFAAYWMNRFVDRDRQNKSEKDLRDWIESKYVAREVLDSKLEALHSRVRDIDLRISRMHTENSGKLDHLLSIVSSLSGLRSMSTVKLRRMEEAVDDE